MLDAFKNYKEFTLTGKQYEFVEAFLRGGYNEYYFLGANRSGKTKVGAYLGSLVARYGLPRNHGHEGWYPGKPTSGWVVSLDFPMSRDTVQPYYFNNGRGAGLEPFIPGREIFNFDRQSQTLILRNESLISFKSCDSGASKFQSAGKDWVSKDEVPPKAIDDEISIRVPGGKRLVQWTTATLLPPEGLSGDMFWLYEEVVKPWKTGDKRNWITNASIYDNPHILREEIRRLEAKYPEGSVKKRIRLDGELLPGISGSLVYSGFHHSVHVREGMEIDPHYPVMWTWDFNVSPMCTLICQKIGGILKSVREIWMEEGSIPEMCDAFMEVISPKSPVWVYGDATGKARSAHTRQTSYTIIAKKLVDRGYVVKMRVPESNPSVDDRINHVNVAFSGIDGSSIIEIDSSCKQLITDLEGVIYDDRNGIRKTTRNSDPYRWRTHISDAFGYLVCAEVPIKMYYGDVGAGKTAVKIPKYGKSATKAPKDFRLNPTKVHI